MARNSRTRVGLFGVAGSDFYACLPTRAEAPFVESSFALARFLRLRFHKEMRLGAPARLPIRTITPLRRRLQEDWSALGVIRAG
jgi:hypothetical protein